jgi:hypothetical protein
MSLRWDADDGRAALFSAVQGFGGPAGAASRTCFQVANPVFHVSKTAASSSKGLHVSRLAPLIAQLAEPRRAKPSIDEAQRRIVFNPSFTSKTVGASLT